MCEDVNAEVGTAREYSETRVSGEKTLLTLLVLFSELGKHHTLSKEKSIGTLMKPAPIFLIFSIFLHVHIIDIEF